MSYSGYRSRRPSKGVEGPIWRAHIAAAERVAQVTEPGAVARNRRNSARLKAAFAHAAPGELPQEVLAKAMESEYGYHAGRYYAAPEPYGMGYRRAREGVQGPAWRAHESQAQRTEPRPVARNRRNSARLKAAFAHAPAGELPQEVLAKAMESEYGYRRRRSPIGGYRRRY